MRVDKEMYDLGKRAPNFLSSDKNLKFYEFRCNWTSNRQTEDYYHVLAYSHTQAEEMAIKEYAKTRHIAENFVFTI